MGLINGKKMADENYVCKVVNKSSFPPPSPESNSFQVAKGRQRLAARPSSFLYLSGELGEDLCLLLFG